MTAKEDALDISLRLAEVGERDMANRVRDMAASLDAADFRYESLVEAHQHFLAKAWESGRIAGWYNDHDEEDNPYLPGYRGEPDQ